MSQDNSGFVWALIKMIKKQFPGLLYELRCQKLLNNQAFVGKLLIIKIETSGELWKITKKLGSQYFFCQVHIMISLIKKITASEVFKICVGELSSYILSNFLQVQHLYFTILSYSSEKIHLSFRLTFRKRHLNNISSMHRFKCKLWADLTKTILPQEIWLLELISSPLKDITLGQLITYNSNQVIALSKQIM